MNPMTDEELLAQIRSTRPEDATILRALAALELKLTELIRSGIASIQQEHNRSMLEQAKLNATFATHERVEQLARQVDQHSSEIFALHKQDTVLIEDRKELHQAVAELNETLQRRTLGFFTTTTGWLVAAVIAFIGPLVSFALIHFFG